MVSESALKRRLQKDGYAIRELPGKDVPMGRYRRPNGQIVELPADKWNRRQYALKGFEYLGAASGGGGTVVMTGSSTKGKKRRARKESQT